MSMNIYRNELIEAMKKLTEQGFKCYILKANPSYMYGFIITPSDNIIYVQRDNYNGGWDFGFKYIPSKENGSGCGCFERPVYQITSDIILQAEKMGLSYAQRLGVKFYVNSDAFLKQLWNINSMVLVE